VGRWWREAAAVAGFALVTVALAWDPVRDLDLALRDLADAHRPPGAETVALLVNRVGSGGLLTGAALVLAVLLAWRRRSAWPLAPVVVTFAVTVAVTMPLKWLFHRAAPHSPLPDGVEVGLFSQPDGLSYPSGHAVNAVVWYGALVLLLAPWLTATTRRWMRWAPPAIVTVTGTYLGHHWLTDMLAGLLLGVLLDRLLARVPWPGLPHRGLARPVPPGGGLP
jgi:membrane-associated phospholipid phosphatase